MVVVKAQGSSNSDLESKYSSLSFTSISSSELHSEVSGKVDAPADMCSEYLSAAEAAVKVQKVYRKYRARRELANSAILAKELWWRTIDYTKLNHSTTSFYEAKHESAGSRWIRAGFNASRLVLAGGSRPVHGLRSSKLAFQHWIEAIDPWHRYGHNLHLYYEEWIKADAGQPFFYWLDVGNGKEVELKECPRSKLGQQCVKYLGPEERKRYEYIVVEGKIINNQTGDLLDTSKASHGEGIFVMSTSKQFYAGEKKKGRFHHSSFLAGGATIAAGMLVAELGVLKSITAHSGHYRPTEEQLNTFLSFLKENGVNMEEVEIRKEKDDSNNYNKSIKVETGTRNEVLTNSAS